MIKRILVAGGSDQNRTEARRTLKENGYEIVGEAKSGMEVQSLAGSLRPDLVVLAATLPGLDRNEVRCELENQGTGLIYTVRSQDKSIVEDLAAEGEPPFVRLPLDPARFSELVHKLVRTSRQTAAVELTAYDQAA